ncbi:MAG: hypothetical protein CUN56_00080 [Phototrophicales bacterium]|nr:MAG: hypothetical protein CUN56_00080 [Phototrophicales bacterium]
MHEEIIDNYLYELEMMEYHENRREETMSMTDAVIEAIDAMSNQDRYELLAYFGLKIEHTPHYTLMTYALTLATLDELTLIIDTVKS